MAGGGIELALHQGRHQVHDRDVHALRLQAGGGFEAQKAAADDHGIAARLGGQQHGLDVVEVAVGQHARQVVAGHRDDDGVGAGGDDQLVVGDGDRRLQRGLA